MKMHLKTLFGGTGFIASLVASALAFLMLPSNAVMAAAPSSTYHCVPMVRHITVPTAASAGGLSGINPLYAGVSAQLMSSNVATVNQTAIVVSGIDLTGPGGAGAVCHQDTVALFNGTAFTPTTPGVTPAVNSANGVTAKASNKVWSDPNQYCVQIAHNDGKLHSVGAYEIITEVGGPVLNHAGKFNLVAGYTVTCSGSHPYTSLNVPQVVPHLP